MNQMRIVDVITITQSSKLILERECKYTSQPTLNDLLMSTRRKNKLAQLDILNTLVKDIDEVIKGYQKYQNELKGVLEREG